MTNTGPLGAVVAAALSGAIVGLGVGVVVFA
jgi:hypothetical protein